MSQRTCSRSSVDHSTPRSCRKTDTSSHKYMCTVFQQKHLGQEKIIVGFRSPDQP
jgi:hypothetical protein